MRTTFLLAASIASLVLGTSSLAFADCSATAFSNIESGYIRREIGEVETLHPVSQSDIAGQCGDFTIDAFLSAQLTGGTFGNRGYGDEADLTGTYDHTVTAPVVGPVQIELSASYTRVAPFKTTNDLSILYAEASRKFTFGSWSVSPFVRATEWLPIGHQEHEHFYTPGVRVSHDFSKTTSLSLETANSFVPTEPYKRSAYAAVTIRQEVWRGWAVTPNIQFTERRPMVFGIGLTKDFH